MRIILINISTTEIPDLFMSDKIKNIQKKFENVLWQYNIILEKFINGFLMSRALLLVPDYKQL